MRGATRALAAAVVLAAATALSACERETRRFSEQPPAAAPVSAVVMSDLQPGPSTPDLPMRSAYEENAWAVGEGKRLYGAFNCSGCHANGGGGIGPPLMDEAWIYGDAPENIFATIVEGRPNGMPSFRGRLGNQQVWQLVAYVRSLSGKVAKDVAPGRSDHMYVSPQEQETRDTASVRSSTPPGAVTP